MNQGQLGAVLRHIQRTIGGPTPDEQTDKHLLERFTLQQDEAAFAALVRRHAALVFGVCWRVLRHPQDTEDAFQATFLVLARKAGSISWRESVNNWLYQVAYRLASETRTKTARRRTHERQAGEMRNRQSPATGNGLDLAVVIDEELQQLPEKYRIPLLLCYLEGRTTDQAAKHLGWSPRTLQRRLEQGRELLRGRLTRRDLTLSAAMLATELVRTSAQAAVPPVLVDSTVKGAILLSAGKAAALQISAQVQSLLQGANQAIYWTKLKLAAAVLSIGAMVGVTGFITHQYATSESKVADRMNGPRLLAKAPEQPRSKSPSLAPSTPDKPPPETKPDEHFWFQDRTAKSGIDFTYRNGEEARS